MLLALALALAGPLEAQQPPTGSIRGIVYDSLIAHGGLGNAVVELLELGRVTRTDARGVFRFDSLPGGSFTLAFSDSSFSSIGFAPPERTVSLGEGIDVAVTLATPSPNTIYRALCPGPREPDTAKPVRGTRWSAPTSEATGW